MPGLKEQFNIGNLIALLGFLFTAGMGTHISMGWDGFIANSVVNQMADTSSTLHNKMQDQLESKADSAILNSVATLAISKMLEELAEGDKEDIIAYYKTNFRFADTMRAALKGIDPQEIKENHNYVKKMIKMRSQYADFVECGKILRHKESLRPNLFIPCEGSPIPIHFGKPNRNDDYTYVNDVYYIRSNGKDVVLSLISNILLRR
jgi:hypothetical protein